MDKTRIYLDLSCLNRPFDDQSQVRIRLEAEAIVLILERLDVGVWRQVSSEIAVIEIDAIADEERRVNVRRFCRNRRTSIRYRKPHLSAHCNLKNWDSRRPTRCTSPRPRNAEPRCC
jgi:hypothetical protein